jgi:hypothetical protein
MNGELNVGLDEAEFLAIFPLKGAGRARFIGTLKREQPRWRPRARRLVATTDRAFQFINNDGPIARLVRVRLAPLLLPALFSFPEARRLMFLTVSQTSDRALAAGSAGRIEAGDRLPWVCQEDETDNFASLRSLDWQAHVYGDASIEIEQACTQAGLSLRRFPWSEAASKTGIARNAFYLVRPDGYVGLAAASDVADTLRAYRARFGLVFAKARRSQPEADAILSGP